jgi:hypothetical protein
MVVETPREEAAFEKAVASRKALEEALKARENPLFDPVLLAIAQGFLAPTKTGSFGESLGNVATMVGPAQASEDKRAIEMAQIRRELAAQELAEAQAISEQQMLRGLPSIFGPSGGVPAGQPAPGGRPAPAGQAAPQAAPSGEVTTTNPDQVLSYVERMSRSSRPALQNAAKQTLELLKFEREGIEIRDGIVINKNRRDASGAPLILADLRQKQEDFSTPYGTFKMTPSQYRQFEKAEEEGKGGEWISNFRRPGGMARPGAAPDAAAGAPGRLTTSESEARAAAQKTEAEATAKSRADQTAQVRTAGKAALGLLPIYDRMEVLLKAPGMDQVLGVLERGDVISALGNLAEEAIRVGTFSVGIPAVRKIVAQTGAPQDVIDRAAELGQLLAITQFEQRKGLGSGTSVSNFEQQMVNAMGPNMTDTLRSFGQKLNFMREKAKFENELAAALRRSKMQYEDFEDTPEFAKLFGEYQRRVTNIVYPGQKPFKVVR